MKEKKWKLILELILTIGVFGLYFYIGHKYSGYVNGLISISNYYYSHGDLIRGDIYVNFYNTLVYMFIVFFPILFIILDINLRMSYRKEFKNYPGVKTQYDVIFYFNLLKSLLFALVLYLFIFYVNSPSSPFSGLIYIGFILIFLNGFDYLHKRIFKNLLNSIDFIRQSDYTEPDLPIKTKRHHIIPIFYIVLCITLLLITHRTILYIEDLKFTNFSHYPDELLITEESKMDQTHVCYGLRCYENDVLGRYNITTIEFSISDEDYKDLIKNSDYNIMIKYKNHNYIVTHEQFVIDQPSSDEYTFRINFRDKAIFKSTYEKARYDVVSIEIEFNGVKEQPDVKELLLVFEK